ncbi:GNAT family N-acetyltransferase [Halopseudomonas nanhaiensis]|nr:GNAT family N-acetyltransferase [Halopseudomonas nanhaiensis]
MRDDYSMLIHHRTVYVASVGIAIAGLLVLQQTRDDCVLENVAVDPAWQRRGIGKLLLEHAERCATGAGYDTICLYTNELMVENRYLYSRIGYREFDRRIEQGFSRVYMRKHLVCAAQSTGSGHLNRVGEGEADPLYAGVKDERVR